jgi:transcription factor TFIIIB component B''
MISSMFPGFPRRAIKTKFTREERDNPEGVREALQSRCLMDDQWGKFLEHSNQTDESFANVDEIKRQMAEKEAEFRERINAAAAEAEERREQRKLAGLDEDGDGTNNGKGKKKRGKGKQVQFQEEQGVEIVGEVGEDDTWGQE